MNARTRAIDRQCRGSTIAGFCAGMALLVTSAGVPAHEVYKCTTPAGDIAYQDRRCAPGADEVVLHVAGDSATAPSPPAAPAESAAAPAPPLVTHAHPHAPLPRIWLCTNAEDGSHYANRFGPPPPRAVPLGVLGYPGKSLAEAYRAGANVMSAPELNKPPIDRSPQSALAASFTQLQDTCIAADAVQTCQYLQQQFDKTNDELGRARFKDERARLQPQVDQFSEELGGC